VKSVVVAAGVRSWRDSADRDEPSRSTAAPRSHRDNVHYDRGDYSGGRRKRFDRFADDDDDEDGNVTVHALSCCSVRFMNCAVVTVV